MSTVDCQVNKIIAQMFSASSFDRIIVVNQDRKRINYQVWVLAPPCRGLQVSQM